MADSGTGKFDFRTWQQVIVMIPTTSVEVCSLAVGELAGHANILSAAWTSNVIVTFLHAVERADPLGERGGVTDVVVVNVLPLAPPSKNIILSNVLRFIIYTIYCHKYSLTVVH